jgi:hypothetical protein
MFRFSRISRPSPAMIVALVALFISATGVAVAAIPGGNGVIHACYNKKGGALRAVSGGKSCPRGTRALSWNQAGARGATGAPGARGATGAPGATGTQGATGAPGTNGTATAFARVQADGTLEPGDSGRQNKNVVAANVEHDATTGAGHYCFGGLPFGVASAMVSPDSAGDINGDVVTSVAVQRGVTLGSCDAQHQQARVTTVVAGAAADHRFQIWFEQTGGPQIPAGPGGE